jgi:hypothetical protein
MGSKGERGWRAGVCEGEVGWHVGPGQVCVTPHHSAWDRCHLILTDSPPWEMDTPLAHERECVWQLDTCRRHVSTGFHRQSATSDGRSSGVSNRLTDCA